MILHISISLVEGEHPVRDASPPSAESGHTPEASMMFVGPFENFVASVTEWSVRAHFAVAKLVIS